MTNPITEAEEALARECDLADADMRKWARVPVKYLRSLIEHAKKSVTLAYHDEVVSEAQRQIHALEAELIERADKAEARIAAVLARHVVKHGETARYAPGDYDHERGATHWEPYVICAHDGTEWPCATVRILRGES